MSIKRRIYVQFCIAVLPLALVLAYVALSRDDLPQRVNTSLRQYELSLRAADSYKDFLGGVADALDSGQLGSRSLDSLRRARDADRELGVELGEAGVSAKRLDALVQAIEANPKVDGLMKLKGEVQSLRAALIGSMEARREALARLVADEGDVARRRQQVIWGVAIAAAVLLAFIGFVVRRLVNGITQPLAESVGVARAIAQGHLRSSIHKRRSDEIGQLQEAMRAMQHDLSRLVVAVRAGAESVASSSQQLTSETAELSARSEEQAASLEQAAASMEELSSTVRENSGNARQANALAQDAADAAVAGGQAVKRVVETMEGISTASRRIEDIVGVIDSIAFQTNILALNAAVEAARAGEQGRGFAVVAAEVRTLAQRAGEAAREIRKIIDASARQVGQGAAQVDEAGRSIDKLVASVHEVTALMAQVSGASAEQERGIDQVGKSITQMDGVVQQNAVAAQRNASQAERLERGAEELERLVSRFDVAEEAAARPAEPPGELRARVVPALSLRD